MSDGLRIPVDLGAWHRWSARQHRLRTLRARARPTRDTPAVTTYRNRATAPSLVVSAASTSPSARAALFAPLSQVGDASIAIVTDIDLAQLLPTWEATTDPWESWVASAKAVLGDGHYLPLGHEVWASARRHDVPYFVSQHGALTPLAPPLPPGAHLLSWSDSDGEFWASGRRDVQWTAVGSQLLWEAALAAPGPRDPGTDNPSVTYAGQLHGAELPRWGMTRAAMQFCRANAALYRPHPGERDRLSRAAHRAFIRAGITIDPNPRPLREGRGALVSAFSTSVLEAAVCGRDAYVHYPDPPPWLTSFWERYGMNRWGGEPTPAPRLPADEPAARISRVVLAGS